MIFGSSQVIDSMERETGIEPATSSLGSWHSTAELLPLALFLSYSTVFRGLAFPPACVYSPCSPYQTMPPDRKVDTKTATKPRSHPLHDCFNLSQSSGYLSRALFNLNPNRLFLRWPCLDHKHLELSHCNRFALPPTIDFKASTNCYAINV